MEEKITSILLAMALFSVGLLVYVVLQSPDGYPITITYREKSQVLLEESSIENIKIAEEITEEMTSTEYIEKQAEFSVSFPLSVNNATEEEFQEIPGIGNVMAQRIVQYRQVLGGYTELEQLLEIKGIGEKIFGDISPYLTL